MKRASGIEHFYVYSWRNGSYVYERTCGTERAAKDRVAELGPRAVFTVNHTIRGAFY